MAALDAGGKAVERNAGVLQRLRHLGTAHVALCQPVGAVRGNNAQLDQTVDVSQVDPGSVGHVRPRVLSHEARLLAGRLRPTVRRWLKRDIGTTTGGSNRRRGARGLVPFVGDVLALSRTSTSRSMPAGDVDPTSCFSVPSTADTLPTMERPTRVFMIAIDRPVSLERHSRAFGCRHQGAARHRYPCGLRRQRRSGR